MDIITFGSPCQDLSVAGKREGLAGERSGLFMEAVRIIKEMRNATKQLSMRGTNEPIRPRFMVWENVTGALTSGSPKGEDFRIVLEETAKVVEPNASIPRPPKGKWNYSGCIMGNGWSIAWRVHDAQFWGVPQRRKRIALVADFGGHAAPEILFERKGVSGDPGSFGEKRETVTADTQRGVNPTSYTLKIRGGVDRDRFGKSAGKGTLVQTELSGISGVSQDQTLIEIFCLEGNGSRNSHRGDGYKESETMHTLNTVEQHAVCVSQGDANKHNVDTDGELFTRDHEGAEI